MIKYVFKDAPLILRNANKADPQKIGETLSKIAQQHSGRLMPENVVNAAKDKKNPLHQHFEWDDSIAAHAYRVDQARSLIRLIRVEDDTSDEPVPAFISVSDRGMSYRTVQEVTANAELQLMVLRQAERDLAAWEKRYRMISDVCEIVRSARAAIERKRSGLEARPAA